LDIVLGVSMAPASIQMVLLEGENADGATVEEDEFDVTAAADSATTSASDRVIAAILGTREGAVDAGLELSSIGVTWTDQLEAAALRDALAAYKLENVMLVSAFLAATALGQFVGGAMGYERTAVLFVEPESATLAVVETSDGSIVDLYRERIYAESYDEATAQLTGMISELEELEWGLGGLFLIGSGVDIAPIKPALDSATSLAVSAPEEPETALARGAALASANAPMFASSTAALAYAQDPGTGAVDAYVLPEYLSVSGLPDGDDDFAYSAVPDEDADVPTVVIDTSDLADLDESQPRRRPVLLVGSGMAVVAISAVVALGDCTGDRHPHDGGVAAQPPTKASSSQHSRPPHLAPVEASAVAPKISAPDTPWPRSKPLNPPLAPALPRLPGFPGSSRRPGGGGSSSGSSAGAGSLATHPLARSRCADKATGDPGPTARVAAGAEPTAGARPRAAVAAAPSSSGAGPVAQTERSWRRGRTCSLPRRGPRWCWGRWFHSRSWRGPRWSWRRSARWTRALRGRRSRRWRSLRRRRSLGWWR
jgi:hypothetical protein